MSKSVSPRELLEVLIEKVKMSLEGVREVFKAKGFSADTLARLTRFCQSRIEGEQPKRDYGFMYQGILDMLGEKFGFKVDYSSYYKCLDQEFLIGHILLGVKDVC